MALSKLKSLLKQFPFIYPREIILSCKEWIDKKNAKSGIYAGARKHSYVLVETAENQTHQLPSLNDKNREKFSINLFYQTSSAYLFNLKDCCVFKKMGLVLTNRNALFQEFTHHFNIQTIAKFIAKHPFYAFSNQVKNVSGTGAVLLSPESHNYYHWLFDVLPRIKLYGPVSGHIDKFCIAADVPQKFLDVLPAFGITSEKILVVNDTEKLHFNNLYVASLPGSEGRSPEWGINYVRSKLMPPGHSAPANQKLYFKRGEHAERKIVNEEQIIRILKKRAFEIIDPGGLTIKQQVALMQQAKIVMAAHGAALSNLLFVQEGTTAVEIFSPDYFRTDCYFTLARILKLDYHYIEGIKPAHAKWGDIVVDENDLTALLNKLALD